MTADIPSEGPDVIALLGFTFYLESDFRIISVFLAVTQKKFKNL